MALFEKKSKVAKALELFNSFTDEELEEFLSSADLDNDGDVDEEDAPVEETAEETVEEPTEELTEEPIEVEEGVAEEPTAEGEEPTAEPVEETEEAPTETEMPVEETPTEEPVEDAPVEETKDIGTDKYQALQSQIDSLKEVIAGLTARLEADQENKEPETEPFGIGMQSVGKETDEKSDVQKAKEKYWAF